MKRVVYFIILGLFVFIPKDVFAENYSINFSKMWGYSNSTPYELTSPTTENQNGVSFWKYDNNSIQNVFKYEFFNGTTNANFDSSITYTVKGYFGVNMREDLNHVHMLPLKSLSLYTSPIGGSYAENSCTYSMFYDNFPFYFYSFTCNNVNLYESSYFDIIAILNTNTLGGFQAYISKQFEITRNDTNAKFDAMIGEQQQTNDKLDEANQTSKGIWGTIKEVLNNIINLPKKLIELMFDLFKSLFVPTDEQLYEIINDSKELSENFGFVGESINFFISIFTSLLGMVNANGCIELPEFTIGSTSLFDSFTFWHAQNICLNDNVILSSNINTIRTITSIFLVGLFINFASRQFFNILNKNENASGSVSYDPRTGEVRE